MTTAMDKSLYEHTVDLLNKRKGDWPSISKATGIPYSTICKIAQGHHRNPSVHSIQTIHDCLKQKKRAA